MEKIRIFIDDLNDVPFIKIDEEKINKIISVNLVWKTRDKETYGQAFFEITYFDGNLIKTLKFDRWGPPMKGGDDDE